MLIDDLTVLALDRKRVKQIIWYGGDLRMGAMNFSEAQKRTPKLQAEALLSVFEPAKRVNAVPLHGLLSEVFSTPFRFVRDSIASLPPWPATYIEMGQQFRGGVLLEATEIDEPLDIRRYFLREIAIKRQAEKGVQMVEFKDPAHPEYALDPSSRWESIDPKWSVTVSALLPYGDRLMFADSLISYLVSPEGELMTTYMLHPEIATERSMEEMGQVGRKILMKVLEMAESYFNRSAMILNLMAADNVDVEDRPIADKLKRARASRGKPPLTEYSELVIRVPDIGRSLGITHGDGEGSRQFFGRRAGFRDYRKKGLFGKERLKKLYFFPHIEGSQGIAGRRVVRLTPGKEAA